jgi:hypothetical protein
MEKICKNCGKFYSDPQERCQYHFDKFIFFKIKEAFCKVGGEDAFKQVWKCCKSHIFKAKSEAKRLSNQDLVRDEKGCLVSNVSTCPKNKKSNDYHEEWKQWNEHRVDNNLISHDIFSKRDNSPRIDQNKSENDFRSRIVNSPNTNNNPTTRIETSNNNNNIPTLLRAKKALIIANTYEGHNSLQELPNSLTDAKKMASILEIKSFQVTAKINASRSEMIRIIKDFGNSLEQGDGVIFYFSGHGLSFDGFHCLLPNDYEGDESTISDFSITFVSLLQKITVNNPLLKIFLFDCCRVRPFEKISTDKGNAKHLSFKTIVSSELGQNILIASATAESAIASGNGRDEMSLWTSYLTEELNKNQESDIEMCLKRVRNKMVEDRCGQTPWESSSLLNDFKI